MKVYIKKSDFAYSKLNHEDIKSIEENCYFLCEVEDPKSPFETQLYRDGEKIFAACVYAKATNVLIVEEICFKPQDEPRVGLSNDSADVLLCPICGNTMIPDEYEDNDSYQCDFCSAVLDVHVEKTITFSSTVKEVPKILDVNRQRTLFDEE